MSKKLVLVGASGNFGCRIARNLIKRLGEENLVFVCRSSSSAQQLTSKYPNLTVLQDDVHSSSSALFNRSSSWSPVVVLNASGPFDAQLDTGMVLAKSCAEHGVHYVDIADDAEFVQQFASRVTQNWKSGEPLRSVLVTGASSVPAIALMALTKAKSSFGDEDIKLADVCISGGTHNTWGVATVASVRHMVGSKYLRRQRKNETTGEYEHVSVRCWRKLRWAVFHPLAQKRLVGEVPTPDVFVIPKFHPNIHSVRASAGVDSSLAVLCIWMLSWIPEFLKPPAHILIKPLNLRWLTRLIGSTVGAMSVTAISEAKNPSISPPKWFKWSLVGEDGDGPEVPGSPATLLAEKLFKSEIQPSSGCYVGGDPALGLTLEDLENFWKDMGFHIACQETVRDFRSPFVEAAGTRGIAEMGDSPVRHAHCYGGYFEGMLEVTSSRYWVVRVLMRILSKPWPTKAPVPVRVWIEPTADEGLVYFRLFNGKVLTSTWDTYKGGVMEIFEGWQAVCEEVRADAKGFELIGRRTWPLPDHWNPLEVYARVDINDDDRSKFKLFVEARAPIVGHLFGYKGNLQVVKKPITQQ